GELKYSREQMRWVEESIRIRGAAEPVELIEAVKKLRKAFTREEKTRKGLPLELNQKVSLEILQRLHDLGEEAIEAWRVGKLKDMRSTSFRNLSNFGLSSEDSNEEIIPGPPLPPECNTELHTDYGGTTFALANIRTPFFILNSAYDVYQFHHILAPPSFDPGGHWSRCKSNPGGCSATQIATLQ
ncbi:hypothetical protein ACJX0J_024345, partial [Zea mays]